ncbi:prepilin peptidase [Salmonella enterica]|uniref:prepilin peptidase n=1 Tax=Salmonella enterica TaxID=28901 RepID=UPI000254A540|nr:prepilin peptidase [Salmonella enterica]EAA2818585.1 prepilin peptidase [Salmonella enterica subsp. enterica serovar Braenderup]EAA3555456.1 prepilin peptidase [Salmonella enterica subsp. enterica serovar Montevideo]EBF8306685.1 prepilin peptidase [Salmonella enterica subsp. enterica serovar Ealing]EBG5750636.1 prepilin peptidase [Salmonella enterica subsp. enterica serovar Monschaui]EBM0715329.1 prepilin peptidase [Salmonella enterica subsp. enterica serovar Agona]EBP3810422.1 prepilin pe
MHTIISISFSPFYLLPLILIFSIVGRTLLFRVRHFFSYTNYVWHETHPAVLSGIWLYGITGGVIVLSSSASICRIHAIIILSFMLQMAVTDAVSGLLPATFTRRFLIAGVLINITTDTWWTRTTETLIAAIILFCFHIILNRRRPYIGTGDLWLIAGITAWSGLYNAIWSVLLGLGGFVLWHSTWRIKRHIEGPLGPWICIGHVLLLLDNLYQPLWVI